VSDSWLGLSGKVAVVTGGASGIGRACCEALAALGAKVVIADVDRAAGEEMVARLERDHGAEALFQATDVTRTADITALVAAAEARFGGVDILVNNAGINIPRLLVDPAGKQELTDDVLDRMIGINLKGVIVCARECARAMLKRGGGVIINMTSESGLEGSEGQSVYSASKAALHGLTRSWGKELGRRGIRVVGVAPGILEATGLRSESYEAALAYTRGITVAALREGYVKTSTIPLGRAGRLSEVADLVCYLASPRASYVHGTVINISGGKTRG
jgi:sorbitol-6-phosphate 2-dehydrogenase